MIRMTDKHVATRDSVDRGRWHVDERPTNARCSKSTTLENASGNRTAKRIRELIKRTSRPQVGEGGSQNADDLPRRHPQERQTTYDRPRQFTVEQFDLVEPARVHAKHLCSRESSIETLGKFIRELFGQVVPPAAAAEESHGKTMILEETARVRGHR